jgi:TonB family protein
LFKSNEKLGSCQQAARLVFMTALGRQDRAHRRSETHVAFVRLDRESVTCALAPTVSKAATTHAAKTTAGVQARILEPKKTKNVAPQYPASALARRAQGTVVMDALISTSGCVTGIIVRETVDPALDIAALRAVADWRYTPGLLDGEPVPIIMTVTVNFKVH